MKVFLATLVCLCVQNLCAQTRILSSKSAEKEGVDAATLANDYARDDELATREVMKKFRALVVATYPENPEPGITVFGQFFFNASGSLDYLLFDIQASARYDKDSLENHTRNAFQAGLEGFKVAQSPGRKFSVMGIQNIGKVEMPRAVRSGDSAVVDLKTALVFQDTLKVKRLFLNQLDLATVPNVIYRFPNLEELYLGSNRLTAVNIDMQRLPRLTQLHLQGNKLTNESLDISPNKTLTLLNLKDNQFADIPQTVRNSKKLSILWLGGNALPELSSRSFRKLKQIQDLNLYKSGIAVLPKGIKKMKNLQVLDLYYNNLETLPSSITKLKKLTHLAVSHNQISALPERIDRMKKIHTLYAHHNHLSKLPARITKMQNLKILDLGYNWFTNFPKELTAFVRLEELDLSSNNFPDFPEQLLEIKQLEKLYLRGNPFVNEDAEKKYSRQLGQLKSKNIEVFY
ncbi:leucine-rich repeat domain-containing protein [Dyadobacter sp. CY326]|uniref:leucine-rich repeat domain-containing protein n=1 Tax=Dyadobacter sp. CY326 TaxID=2907300 RepID=UPI001F270983|nr:leucine-rich repeat domain-containing protein [Dyadobacter sp. CY326]MCE7066808.1 leucine-rich repeat domain-containing protein [Dyadobacter sp. CY326]